MLVTRYGAYAIMHALLYGVVLTRHIQCLILTKRYA